MSRQDHEDLKSIPLGTIWTDPTNPANTLGLAISTIIPKVDYRFKEDEILKELGTYIDKTYSAHYVGKDNVQAFDLINAAGHGTGFCVGNIIKYASRYGKKNGTKRDDLLKILHYAIMQLYVHDKEEKK